MPVPSAIYELRRYSATPEGAVEFVRSFRDDLLPVLKEHGFDLVGAWTVEIGEQEGADLIWLLRWKCLAQRDTAYAAVRADERNSRFRQENLRHLRSTSSMLLNPTPFSPLS